MSLAGGIIKYTGGELAKNAGKELANKAVTSALSSIVPKLATKAGAKVANKIGNEFIAGSVLNSFTPTTRMLDKAGNPVTLYHSTPNEFDKFDDAMLGSNTGYDNTALGHFVTSDKDFSKRFIDIDNVGKTGRTMELQGNIQKPITHPYMAGYKYDNKDLDKIVEDYLLATDNPEFLDELKSYAVDDNSNLYDEYMNMTIADSPFEVAGSDRQSLMDKGYDAVEIVEGPKSGLVEGAESNAPVSSYAVFNGENLRPIRHIPINQISSIEDVPVSTLRQLFRGQLYSDTDFSYNSPSMNSGDSSGSQALGGAYHFTPDEGKANAWADNAGGGVIKIGYKPDQLLKAEDAKRMIQEAADKLNDSAYMSKLWQTDPELAEQIELVGIGNLEALAKREGKPFVEHINHNDDELGTIYYYKDVDEGLTEKFREQFRKTNAEKHLGKPKIQQSKVELSPQQQEFFKDSVVRDKEGNLMPVFHTTKTNGRISKFNADNGMVWVTPNKMYSTGFAGNGYNPDRTYKLYADIKNPVYVGNIDPAINDNTIERLSAYSGVDEETLLAIAEKYDARNIWKITNSKEFKELMQAKGYDGIEAREGGNQVSYAAFSPEQVKNVGNLNPTNNPDINYSEIAMANGGSLDEKTKRAIEIINQANNFGQPVENALYNKIDPSTLPKGYPELAKLLDSGTSSDNVIAKRVAEKIGTDDPTNADLDKVLDYLYVGDNREKRVFKKSLEEKIKKFERDSKALGLDIDDPRDRMTKSEMYKLFGQVWNKARKEEIDKIIQLSDGTDIMNALMDPSRRGIRTGTAGGLDTALSERLGIAPGNTIKINSDRYSDYGSPQSAGRYHREFRDIAINSKGGGIEGQVSTMAHERLHSFQNEAKPNNLGRYSKEVSDAYLELQKDLTPFLKSKDEIANRYGRHKADYWASDIEQEARMLQNYLENTGITDNALSSIASGEWGDEIKPAFDKFFEKLRKLSKKGVALPAVAGLVGIGTLADKKDDKSVDNIK